MKQTELEFLTGIPQSTLSKMSFGIANLGNINLDRISDFLDRPVYEIRNRDQAELYLDVLIKMWSIKKEVKNEGNSDL